MTTASLSGLLTRVRSLTDADVRELEKLADSYPYCQTAHLLLAKALHDRGSVLAGQKLRRAATGAPDRRALRRLLLSPSESPTEDSPLASASSETPALAVSADGELVAHPVTEPVGESEAPVAESVSESFESEMATPAAASEVEGEAAEESSESLIESPEQSPTEVTAEVMTEEETPVAEAFVEAEPAVEVENAMALPPVAETEVVEIEAQNSLMEVPVTESVPTTVLADFDLVPDTSPAAVDLLLFEPDEHATPAGLSLLPAEEPVAVPTLPLLAPDPAIAYWLPVSRLGVELTAADFAPTTADGVSDPAPAADLTQAWLQQAPPDARWTEHVAAHHPPAPDPVARRPFDHQFALIERFLREKPRLRAVDPTRPLPDKLPDLASHSTRADDVSLVSESMARILARQGKTARAVAMYEQLQARLPEKAAIFAAQIAALRSGAS